MRLVFPSGTRNLPTDRNPTRIDAGAGFSAFTAGGAVTLATYTVPALRRFELRKVDAYARVQTVLGAAQAANILLLVNGNERARRVIPLTSAVGIERQLEYPGLFLVAGDVLTVQGNLDAGTGAVSGTAGINGVEYDA